MAAGSDVSSATRSPVSCCLLVVCGLPGAGKTTLAQQLVRTGREHDSWCFLHVRLDDFYPPDTRAHRSLDVTDHFNMKEHRRSVNGCLKRCLDRLTQDTTPSSDGALSTSSSKNQSDSHQAGDPQSSDSDVYRLRKFIQSVNSHSGGEALSAAGSFLFDLNNKKLVFVIDDNLPMHSMRYEYCQIAREYHLGFATLFLRCPIDVAKHRNAQRQCMVPVSTLETMTAQLEPPDPSKHRWERNSMVLDASAWEASEYHHTIWSNVSLLCKRALHDPFSSLPPEDIAMKDSCRRATRDSVLHQADQVLRQCVSTELKIMKENCCSDLSTIARQANAVRRQILEELRRENEWTTLQSPTDVDFREILMEKFSLLMK